MHVVGESGFDAHLLIGPDQGAMRLFLLGGVVPAGFATNAHHHHGEEIFRVLMGDHVEPRREFIEKHALEVRDLDI